MVKLYIDPGHGGTDPGAQGSGLREKEITLEIALKIRALLVNNYENVEVRMSRTGDTTKSLSDRSSEANAWGADYYLSIHCNAFNGSAQGYEDYIWDNLSNSSQTARYRDIIHAEVVKVNQLINRGKKKANFHVLRETFMPAMLSENGFIDNSHDAALMRDPSWRQKVAQGHVNGLVKVFNLRRKSSGGETGSLYKVIAGSFQVRENAEDRVQFLATRGIDSFISRITISGRTWYRVQAGAFSSMANAEQRLQEVKAAGISDAYITS